MGRQIVQPTGHARALVVARIAQRLMAAIGDRSKYGEGHESLVADALVVVLGRPTLRTISHHIETKEMT
ncbi:hypothetical protein Amn_31000 [Aminobacter sp. Y103A]|nr:hypothetical protein Amn_31000 [Aminobacter sp. SS-2016]